jgi:small-conductance mechanosensitive channel
MIQRLGDRAAASIGPGKRGAFLSISSLSGRNLPSFPSPLRPIFGDILKSTFFLLTKPFGTGERIRLGESSGIVSSSGLAYTVLEVSDRERRFIPTHTLYSAPITVLK